jgi:DNA-binding response OmpR family regulator
MLPGLDGYEVCKQVRAKSDVPIIMVTARDDDIDKIIGLELGADDYLAKPFNPRELVARVKAILRRSSAPRGAKDDGTPIHVGDVSIDQSRREVMVAGHSASLRAKEFDLLHTLAENRGRVLTREQLLDAVWAGEPENDNVVAVYIGYVRQKLEEAGEPRLLHTIRGAGYALRE